MHKSIRSRGVGSAKVTLEMVAERAGVSPSTVSRILNGTAEVSEEKRAAVHKAITELGFVPNPVARGLAGGRTLSIGVLTQAIDSPFYGAGLRAIEVALGAAGYTPLFMSGHWSADEEARCIEALRSRHVDGIIVLTGRLSDGALKSVARSLPVVVTGRSLEAPHLVALDIDHQDGARQATQHLLDLGHRRIAFIGGVTEHPDAVARETGYRQALAAAGVPCDEALVVPGAFTEASGQAAVEHLLRSGIAFSAIFAANDQMAIGAALGLYRQGRRIPADVSLVGFDDVAGSMFSVPPLTTVHNPIQEIGELATRAMLQLLAGDRPVMQAPAPRLIVRESTRAYAG